MGWLGPAKGIFRFHASDEYCGSLISRADAAEIFEIPASLLDPVPAVHDGQDVYHDEAVLQRVWSDGRIPTRHQARIRGATRSLDELIIQRLAEVTLQAQVTPQVPFGRRSVDLQIRWGNRRVFIEFLGPAHFIPQYTGPKPQPEERKALVEAHFGDECVLWPYWIQRCRRNLLALFDRSTQGLASVWSTRAFFGDFTADDAATVVRRLTDRFGAIYPDGIGYMYTDERVHKPVHPIVARIAAGRVAATRLIPKGATGDERFWLPRQPWQAPAC